MGTACWSIATRAGPVARPAHEATLRIALTGGVASGKSTVARLFDALGVPIIDTDQVARDIVAPGTPALAQIAGQFGPEVLRADGALDRARLREIGFQIRRPRGASKPSPIRRSASAGRSAGPGRRPLPDHRRAAAGGNRRQRQYDRVLLVDCDPTASSSGD